MSPWQCKTAQHDGNVASVPYPPRPPCHTLHAVNREHAVCKCISMYRIRLIKLFALPFEGEDNDGIPHFRIPFVGRRAV